MHVLNEPGVADAIINYTIVIYSYFRFTQQLSLSIQDVPASVVIMDERLTVVAPSLNFSCHPGKASHSESTLCSSP